MLWTMNSKPGSVDLAAIPQVSLKCDSENSISEKNVPRVVAVEFPNKKRKWSERTQLFKPQRKMSLVEGISANRTTVNQDVGKVHVAVQCTEAVGVCQHVRTFNRNELSLLRIKIAMISDSDGDSPIHVAVAQENIKLVEKLCNIMLKSKISLDLTNYLRQTPLHLAVILGNVEMIKLLLKHGASIILRDRNGNSVIHLAVKSSVKKEVLRILLSRPESKTILNSLDHEGYSALHYAVQKNNEHVVSFLCGAGAHINIIDGKSGRSPLIHAILDKKNTMVDILLKCGACAEVVDYSGRTAFELALHSSNNNIIHLLERHMVTSKNDLPHYEQSKNYNDSTVKRTKKERKAQKTKIKTSQIKVL